MECFVKSRQQLGDCVYRQPISGPFWKDIKNTLSLPVNLPNQHQFLFQMYISHYTWFDIGLTSTAISLSLTIFNNTGCFDKAYPWPIRFEPNIIASSCNLNTKNDLMWISQVKIHIAKSSGDLWTRVNFIKRVISYLISCSTVQIKVIVLNWQ